MEGFPPPDPPVQPLLFSLLLLSFSSLFLFLLSVFFITAILELVVLGDGPLEKLWGGGGGKREKKFTQGKMRRKKNHAKEKVKKKIHAEGRSNCDFFRKSEFLSESLRFRNQQYYQAQYE